MGQPGCLLMPNPDRVSVRDVRLELATPLGPLIVPLEAELPPEQHRAAFVLEAERAELAAPAGQLRADLRIEGEMPLDPETLARETTASGRLQLRAEGMSLPGVASGLDGAGEGAFVLERSRLQASLSGTRLQLEAIAPEWDVVAAVLPAPWRVELARPVGISASFRGEEILLEGGGDLALATAGPHLSAALSASLTMTRTGGCARSWCPMRRSICAMFDGRTCVWIAPGSERKAPARSRRWAGTLIWISRAPGRLGRADARSRHRPGRSGRPLHRRPAQSDGAR